MMAVAVRKPAFLGFLCVGVQAPSISHIHKLTVIRNPK